MDKLFYLDTSIWLDIFEDRDEAKFPKSQIARALLSKIIKYNLPRLVMAEIMLQPNLCPVPGITGV